MGRVLLLLGKQISLFDVEIELDFVWLGGRKCEPADTKRTFSISLLYQTDAIPKRPILRVCML